MSEHTPTLLKADENYVLPVEYISRRPYICTVRFCQEGGADPETQANADRIAATWNAFHSPDGRKIATEDIAEGSFWNVYRFMEWVAWQPCTCAEDSGCMSCQACDLLSSLKVQEPDND